MLPRDAGGFGERLLHDLIQAQRGELLSSMVSDNQYLIYIRGNTLEGAAEEALHITYWFLTRALQEHRKQGRNGDYEAFAVGVLALLQRYRHLYTTTQDVESQEQV